MKLGIIFDVHQTAYWKVLIDKITKGEIDKGIILGDLFDTHRVGSALPTKEAIENAKEIIAFKKQYPDKVDLIWGNHDYQYYRDVPYNNFQNKYHLEIQKLFEENKDLFRVAVQYDKWLISHAGISKGWMDRCKINSLEEIEEFWDKYIPVFDIDYADDFPYYNGSTLKSSPIWIRPHYLLENPWKPYQIVGHTGFGYHNKPFALKPFKEDGAIIFGDNFTQSNYLQIDSNETVEGKNIDEALKIIKKEDKEFNNKKSVEGEYFKKLRDKYHLTKEDLEVCLFFVGIERRASEEHNCEFDFYESLEEHCKSRMEEKEKKEK